MKRVSCIVFVILSLSFAACKKPSPQLPANKGVETDTTSSVLLKINNALIVREDSAIRKFAENNGSFQKNGLGFWYKIFKSGTGRAITDSLICNYEFRMESLNGRLFQKGINRIVIGKKQTIVGLEEGIKMMHKGDSAVFVIPWYLGYGAKGEDHFIKPYTSLLYKVNVMY